MLVATRLAQQANPLAGAETSVLASGGVPRCTLFVTRAGGTIVETLFIFLVEQTSVCGHVGDTGSFFSLRQKSEFR